VLALSELAGLEVHWKVDLRLGIPATAGRHYVLFNGETPVVEAQALWERLKSFDVVMESGDGTYQVHMDLADPARLSVAWKAGVGQSVAGFRLQSEGMITCKGWITTATGRQLAWAPVYENGYDYVVFAPGGPALVTMSATAEVSIGGHPGRMVISAEGAADPELGGLVALAFALANEQVLLLHRAAL
jgi:hypothetical protein